MIDVIAKPKKSIKETMRIVTAKTMSMFLNIIAFPPLVLLILLTLILAFIIKTKNLIEDVLERS